ncbi:MAG TPA: ribbon-helix-helix domain-containing protein [Candidatus Lokiarchaeia archaeon]
MKKNKKKAPRTPMKNITINLPTCYDKNIQWLIDNKIISSRSEAIRTALRDFLRNEYETNLELLGYEDFYNEKKSSEKEGI